VGFTQNIVLVPFQQAEATVAWALRHIVSLRACMAPHVTSNQALSCVRVH
jgi:hypothetical protein